MAMKAGEETTTQVLHQLTSYEPGRDWIVPVGDTGCCRISR
jgi:hypothetical protein